MRRVISNKYKKIRNASSAPTAAASLLFTLPSVGFLVNIISASSIEQIYADQ
jgi:hypothetical protein